MINNILLWSYLLNTVLLIIHEIDGAYWKEWKLFGKIGTSLGDEKGLKIYLLAHIPILIVLLYGLVSLDTYLGLLISLALSFFLLIHFIVHMLVKNRNPKDFNKLSFVFLYGTLIISLIQLPTTIYTLFYH